MQCEGFTLPANASRKIEIAFTPDFTLTKVQQQLEIVTDVGSQRLVYPLQAFIPASLLTACTASLPRPSWEPLIYYTVLSVLIIMLGATLLIAMMDADLLIKESVNNNMSSAAQFDKEKIFNLNSIAQKDSNGSRKVSGVPFVAVTSNGVHDNTSLHARNRSAPNSTANGGIPKKGGSTVLAANNKYNKNTFNKSHSELNNKVELQQTKSSRGHFNDCDSKEELSLWAWLWHVIRKGLQGPDPIRRAKKDSAAPPQAKSRNNSIQHKDNDQNSSESETNGRETSKTEKYKKKNGDAKKVDKRRTSSKERNSRNNNNNNSEDDSLFTNIKSSQKDVDEEDSLSSTTETSNIDELSASDKVLMSFSMLTIQSIFFFSFIV